MNKKTSSDTEIKKFSDMAAEWWDPNGKFSPLHKFNPVRQEYLVNKIAKHFLLDLDKNFSFSKVKTPPPPSTKPGSGARPPSL